MQNKKLSPDSFPTCLSLICWIDTGTNASTEGKVQETREMGENPTKMLANKGKNKGNREYNESM